MWETECVTTSVIWQITEGYFHLSSSESHRHHGRLEYASDLNTVPLTHILYIEYV